MSICGVTQKILLRGFSLKSEFGAEALLLAHAVITDWRIAKVIRLFQPPRGELLLPIEIRGEMSFTGFRQMGITATC
jgi:hypothetical protein